MLLTKQFLVVIDSQPQNLLNNHTDRYKWPLVNYLDKKAEVA